jgi:hypothetical protein
MNFHSQLIPVLADAGVPMIYFEWPAMVILFVPVFLIEALFFQRRLSLTFFRASEGSFIANLASTFVGVPLAWAFMLILELISFIPGIADKVYKLPSPVLIVLGMAWEGPGIKLSLVPVVLSLLLIPTFFLSVFFERLILTAMWKGENRDKVRKAVWKANLLSYSLLFLVGLAAGIWLAARGK